MDKIKDAIEQSLSAGSQTFERSLLNMFVAGKISREEALSNADSRTDMEWLMANASTEVLRGSMAQPAMTIDHEKLDKAEDGLENFTINPEFLDQIAGKK